MDSIQRAKALSLATSLFFGICSIIAFSVSQKIYPQYSLFPILFGIVLGCFMLLWIQILYRLSTLKPEQIQINSTQFSIGASNLLRNILKSQEFTFQFYFCSTLAIILSYFSTSFFFTKEFSQFSGAIFNYYEDSDDYYYYRYYKYDHKLQINELNNKQSNLIKVNYFLFMVLFSLIFGYYLQIQFIIQIFFKIFDIKDDYDNVIIKLNLNLKDTELQLYQKNIVHQSIIYIFLWISLLTIRLIINIIFSQDQASEGDFKYAYYSGFIFIQSGCFILFFLIVLIFLIQILFHVKNNYVEVISQNHEYFSSWLTLISSLIHSSRIRIIGLFVLGLMLTQSIYGFAILNMGDFIFTMFRGEYMINNILIIDTFMISIFLGYKFLDMMLKCLFPFSHPPSAQYNFSIQSTLYQVQTIDINDINKQIPETPETQNGDKLN